MRRPPARRRKRLRQVRSCSLTIDYLPNAADPERKHLDEAGLARTMVDMLTVLRHASQPLGPMGAEWSDRQDRVLKREDQ
jgi:hypothetical protein